MAKTLQEKRQNQILYISIGCVLAGIILFIILFSVFTRINKNKNEQKLAQINNDSQNTIEQANSQIGKSIEESQNSTENISVQIGDEGTIQNIEGDLTVADEEFEEIPDNASIATEQEIIDIVETETIPIQENVPDPTFIMPVEGEVVKQYGKEKLIYSNTLKEWTAHLGVDIKADKTTIVKSSSDGVVKSIKNDPRYGLTIVVEHTNGFTSVYSNLLTAEFVTVGENVKSGQTIGTVGNTASFEIVDEPHLHFEILKDGNNIDPEMYIR